LFDAVNNKVSKLYFEIEAFDKNKVSKNKLKNIIIATEYLKENSLESVNLFL